MKKRVSLSVLFLLNSLFAFSQAEIRISLIDFTGKVPSNQNKACSLPLKLFFSGQFNNRNIEFRKLVTGERIFTGQFGNDIQIYEDTDRFLIRIEEGRMINAGPDPGTIAVPGEGFSMNLAGDTADKILIRLDSGVKEASVNGTPRSEYIPGYLLYDAIYIKENFKPGKSDTVIAKILEFYGLNKSNIHENKYLQHLKVVWGDVQAFRLPEEIRSIPAMVSAVGGLDVTNIADGFAKFIVERTKRELSISFFNKFTEELNKHRDLQSLFPQTTRTLNLIGNEIYMYEAYLQTLRESFEKDLATLPSNLPGIVDNHQEYFDSNPELKAQTITAFYLSNSMQDKEHPGRIIEGYKSEQLFEINPNLFSSIKTLQLLSISLKAKYNPENYWAPKSDIEKLYSDHEILKIYLGLLSQCAKLTERPVIFESSNNGSYSLSGLIDTSYYTVEVDLPQYKNYLERLTSKVKMLDGRIRRLNQERAESLIFEDYYSIVTGTIDLLRLSLEVETLPHFPEGVNIRAGAEKYFKIARSAADMVIDVSRRNYSSAVSNGFFLCDQIFTRQYTDNYLLNVNMKSESDSARVKEELAEIPSFSKSFFKYGSFMALIAQAESSEEVEAAIEAFALPSGSSLIKRETPFNISLNSYCGLFAGGERIQGIDHTVVNSVGVTAPIGIAVSRGHSIFFAGTGKKGWNEGKKAWSTSFFLSFIDIGALAAFRFGNDSAEYLPTIQLKNIVSPGAFISLGFPKIPISLNLGCQAGPLLREVNVAENTISENYIRYSVSLAVDIPILNFYTRSR